MVGEIRFLFLSCILCGIQGISMQEETIRFKNLREHTVARHKGSSLFFIQQCIGTADDHLLDGIGHGNIIPCPSDSF